MFALVAGPKTLNPPQGFPWPSPCQWGDVLLFLARPRSENEIVEWCRQVGVAAPPIQEMIRSGVLLKVEGGSPREKLECFRGYRLAPQCSPFPYRKGEPLTVGRDGPGGPSGCAVRLSTVQASTIWESLPGEDIPSTVRRLAAHHPDGLDSAAGEFFNGLGVLMGNRLVSLRPIWRPRRATPKWFNGAARILLGNRNS